MFCKSYYNCNIFLGEKCRTNNEGPAKNKECKFPWRYNGVMRDGCTDETVSDGRFVDFSEYGSFNNYVQSFCLKYLDSQRKFENPKFSKFDSSEEISDSLIK